MKDLKLTAVIIEAEEGGYVAYLEELQGVATQGETLEEVEENLYDALELYLEPDKGAINVEGIKIGSQPIKKPFVALQRQ
jgi:predicted RNase H-like HicB family nuclease